MDIQMPVSGWIRGDAQNPSTERWQKLPIVAMDGARDEWRPGALPGCGYERLYLENRFIHRTCLHTVDEYLNPPVKSLATVP